MVVMWSLKYFCSATFFSRQKATDEPRRMVKSARRGQICPPQFGGICFSLLTKDWWKRKHVSVSKSTNKLLLCFLTETETETCFRFHHTLKWKRQHVSVSIIPWNEIRNAFPFPSTMNLLSIYVVDWKQKHVSISIIPWNGNRNMFPFPAVICLW